MKTVLQFAAKAGQPGGFGTTAGENPRPPSANPGGSESGTLRSLRAGTTAISALSKFGAARLEAQALKTAAWDEEFAGRQEYVQAAERSAALQRAYNETVEAQLAVTSGLGIDLASGSVVAAREQAQREADRQAEIDRNGTDMNARLRRARAASLRGQASLTLEAGWLNLFNDGSKMVMQAMGTGG